MPRMRWLLHGQVTPAAAEALRRHGQDTRQPGEVGLGPEALPDEVLRAAGEHQLEVFTADAALVAAPYEAGVPFGRTMVYLQLAGGEVEQDDAVDRLFERYKRLSPGRLYTVTETRVKVRQLPGRR